MASGDEGCNKHLPLGAHTKEGWREAGRQGGPEGVSKDTGDRRPLSGGHTPTCEVKTPLRLHAVGGSARVDLCLSEWQCLPAVRSAQVGLPAQNVRHPGKLF